MEVELFADSRVSITFDPDEKSSAIDAIEGLILAIEISKGDAKDIYKVLHILYRSPQ